MALTAGEDPHPEWVGAASERISHRGPDDDGFYTDPSVALGFRRLAIIDLSAGGHQPMRSADGRYFMVFNGEIYNYVELADELRREGVPLRTASDSEILLEAYARYGKNAVRRLRGMFAARPLDDRPARWERERMQVLASRVAARAVSRQGHCCGDLGGHARLGRCPPAQRCTARCVFVRRD
jgi:asparagine synthetase B (glutamine-hydrolysing)